MASGDKGELTTVIVFCFQPFGSRWGKDTVIGLRFDRRSPDFPAIVGAIKQAGKRAQELFDRRNAYGWLSEHRAWFVEPWAWPVVTGMLLMRVPLDSFVVMEPSICRGDGSGLLSFPFYSPWVGYALCPTCGVYYWATVPGIPTPPASTQAIGPVHAAEASFSASEGRGPPAVPVGVGTALKRLATRRGWVQARREEETVWLELGRDGDQATAVEMDWDEAEAALIALGCVVTRQGG